MEMVRNFARFLYQNKILLVLILAFLLRFALFSFFIIPHKERCMSPDSYGYDSLAVNILEHRVFSTSQQSPFIPNLHRTPLYPLFLSIVYLPFRHSIVAAIFFQVIMGALIVLVTYKLGVKLFNETVALFAAFLLAIDPVSVIYSNYLLTETLFTLLLVLGLYFLISFFTEENIFSLVMSGFLLGLSALTRPISLYLPIALLLIFIYKYRGTIGRLIAKSVIFLIIFLIPVGFWIVRNYRITGTPIFCTIGDANMLHLKAAQVTADISGESVDKVEKRFMEQYPLDLINNPQEYKANVKLGRTIILNHPLTYAKLVPIGIAKILLGPGRASIYLLLGFDRIKQVDSLAKLFIIIIEFSILALIYLGFVCGVFFLIRDKNYFALAFIFLILFYFVVLPAGPEAYARYRVPVAPYISLLSGLGFYGIFSVFKKHPIKDGAN